SRGAISMNLPDYAVPAGQGRSWSITRINSPPSICRNSPPISTPRRIAKPSSPPTRRPAPPYEIVASPPAAAFQFVPAPRDDRDRGRSGAKGHRHGGAQGRTRQNGGRLLRPGQGEGPPRRI